MEYLNLLILEDNDHDFEAIHRTSIETFNKSNNSINFNYCDYRCKDFAEAENLLFSDTIFHSAIIDLKLAHETADEGKGNELVSLITEKYRIPIFVYSNNTALLDPKFDSKMGIFLNSYKKSQKPLLAILDEIIKINGTGIVEIIGKRGRIEEVLDKVFWKHISISLGNWLDIRAEKMILEKMLLRHVSEYVLQYLGIKDDTGEYEKFNKIEFYTIPPIHNSVVTGDIIRCIASNEIYIVLTPSCDLANKKAKKVLLAKVIPNTQGIISSTIAELRKYEQDGEKNEEKCKELKSQLEKLISNNYSPKYYFLPYTKEIEGGLINFQEIISLKLELINDENYKRLASISTLFIKNIVSKFSYYYSRQGSPDLDNEEIMNDLIGV